MKILISVLFALMSLNAHAQSSGTSVRLDFSSTNIGITNYQTLVTQTARAIKGIEYRNSGPYALKLGIAGGGAVANSETQVAILHPLASQAVYLPITISGGYRIGIIGYSSVTSGVGEFNFVY